MTQEKGTLCKTKAGKGFKFVVDGKWFYTSAKELYMLLSNKAKACQFRTIEEKAAPVEVQSELLCTMEV